MIFIFFDRCGCWDCLWDHCSPGAYGNACTRACNGATFVMRTCFPISW